MTDRLCKISLFSAILASVISMPAVARVTVKKSGSYAGAYNQVMNVRQQAEYMSANQIIATTNSATSTLPVAVDDANLEQDILNNNATDVNTDVLENCSMIYPTGVFRWGIPEAGIRKNPMNQCIAVVELRDANTNKVLAQTTLASGDAMKCNIDMFPESGWLKELEDVTLPLDAEPTIAQVEEIMNIEQRQNAGLKIAAAAIISGIAGNMLAPKEAGDTKLLGTGKTQLIDTAIGATAGAGIMAASTYTGKVAGDTIKSTAVNAATGMVVGNMAAGMSGGNGILYTTKCEVDGTEYDCIVGKIRIPTKDSQYTYAAPGEYIYLINRKKDLLRCKASECTNITVSDDTCVKTCDPERSGELINIKVNTNNGKKLLSSIETDDDWWGKITSKKYRKTDEIFEDVSAISGSNETDPNVYTIVEEAITGSTGGDRLAYAVFNSLPRRLNGYKTSEWESLLANNPRYFSRNLDGTVGDEFKTVKNDEPPIFIYTQRDASDGALVDLSNEARNKATITGAVAGGARGGFAGYQGAKQEVSERWTAAIREYNDSLSNFVCMTGARFLAKYNDYAEIPEMRKSE